MSVVDFSLASMYYSSKARVNKMIYSKTGLLTKPTFTDFLHGKLIASVPFAAALIAIAKYSEPVLWPLVYIGIFLLHATHVYLRKCPHCAYYKAGDTIHRCHYIWELPKIMKERSGASSGYLRIYTPIAVLVITFFPVYWLFFQWEL